MARFLKFKFQTILKLNFIKKYKIMVITKNCKFSTYIKIEKENVDYLG